jgi:hypothetical protein
MAFGALGRARAASSSGDGAARPQDSSQTNDTQAFAASAADEATDTSDIPDPAAYEQRADAPAATAQVSANKPPTTPILETSPPPELNRTLVVGIPLAAAVALMGVYWLILRVGAV